MNTPTMYEAEMIVVNARRKIDNILRVITVRELGGIKPTDEPFMHLHEVYQNITVLNEQIRKLDYYKDRLNIAKPIVLENLDKLYEKINENIEYAQSLINQWKEVKYIGEFSNETSLVYTGFRGNAWYDAPLKEFLRETVGRVFVVKKESILVNDMKSLLKLLNTLYADVEYITINEVDQVPKNPLIGIIQQLMLIEMSPPDTHYKLSRTLRSMRKARRDRAMFKISNDFQVNSNTIANIFDEYDLLNYDQGKISFVCGTEMLKDPPTWVKHVIGEKPQNTTTKSQVKEYQKELKRIKREFLKNTFGRKADMNDVKQDILFQTNLDKYNKGEFTRLSKMNMNEYNKLYNIVSSQIR